MKYLQYLIFTGALSLVLLSSGCKEEFSPEVSPTINPEVIVSDGPHYVGCPVSITGMASAGATLVWLSSEGLSYTGSNLNIIFDHSGTYTFTLTATVDGHSAVKVSSVTILDQNTFSESFQKDGKYTEMFEVLPHPSGGFVGFGAYCHTQGSDISCASRGYQLYWFNEDGSLRTTRSFGNSAYPFWPQAMVVASDGNVVIAYTRYSSNNNSPSILCLSKMGETGDIIWRGSLESPWALNAQSLLERNDGVFIVGGYAERNDGMKRAGMYLFDADGIHIESIPFGELNETASIGRLIHSAPEVVLGIMNLGDQMKVVSTRRREIFDLQASDSYPSALLMLPNREIVAVTSSGAHLSITKLTRHGPVISQNTFQSRAVVRSAVLLDNGNILIAGHKTITATGYSYLAEVTLDGEIVWEKQSNRENTGFNGLQLTQDCGILAVGFEGRPGTSNNTVRAGYFVKVKSQGDL